MALYGVLHDLKSAMIFLHIGQSKVIYDQLLSDNGPVAIYTIRWWLYGTWLPQNGDLAFPLHRQSGCAPSALREASHDDVIKWKLFSPLLAICAGNSGEFPTQRPVTRSFDVFFDLRLNKRLSKQSWGWWFETPSRPLWRHCNGCNLKALHTDLIAI